MTIFKAKSLETILSTFTSTINDLKIFSEEKIKDNEKLTIEIREKQDAVDKNKQEINQATSVILNIENILNQSTK